jgi:hypothetical protein
MRRLPAMGLLGLLGIGFVGIGTADDWGRWPAPWRGEGSGLSRDGPCQEKRESKPGEFKREIKCKDGVGRWWGREWKEEYWDGPCKVTIDAKRDEYKEEVKCERRR